jgi:AhpD family alkylhydroperoxidase
MASSIQTPVQPDVQTTRWYAKNSSLGEAYQKFADTCNEETILDKKTKELLQLALASVFRCSHCTESHIKKAIAAGASKQEISEALIISAQQAAGTQLSWNRDVFEKYLGEKTGL